MVKVFMVYSRPKTKSFVYGSISVSSSTTTFQNPTNDASIVVVANNIAEVANKYPDAESIDEYIAKDVIILDSVKVVCPVKHD